MKTIALRFGETFSPDCGTIIAHQQVIDKLGYVWYGKTGAALADKGPIGQRIGESNSTIIMGIISLNAKDNNLQKAAENGGIKNVTQVEYIDDLILGGMLIKHTTRVYGE